MFFGAQEGDDLRDLRIGERIGEGGHLLSPIHDLIGDLCGRPLLVGADIGKRWALFCAFEMVSVAMDAALIAEEGSAGEDVG